MGGGSRPSPLVLQLPLIRGGPTWEKLGKEPAEDRRGSYLFFRVTVPAREHPAPCIRLNLMAPRSEPKDGEIVLIHQSLCGGPQNLN